jgi:peptide/nickel transport system permease protein
MGEVARIIGHRLWSGVLVLVGAGTVSFFALRLAPGDPVDILLGPQVTASPQVRAQITAELGLDRPVWQQFLHTLVRPLTGDFGRSYQLGENVTTVLGSQAWPTVRLALAATVLAVSIAVLTATCTAGRGHFGRTVVSGLELVAVSLPSFWLGLLLLTVFSFGWHLFPPAGDRGFASLVLPAVSLGLPLAGELAQVLRGTLDRTLEQPFVTTLRARGLSETSLRLRHALRHGSLPSLTLTGWMLGSLMTGTVLAETLFSRPGLGKLTLNAVISRDFPVVTAVVLFAALLFVALNLAVDLLYLVLDPRLRKRTA